MRVDLNSTIKIAHNGHHVNQRRKKSVHSPLLHFGHITLEMSYTEYIPESMLTNKIYDKGKNAQSRKISGVSSNDLFCLKDPVG